jgi:hypothetical protein
MQPFSEPSGERRLSTSADSFENDKEAAFDGLPWRQRGPDVHDDLRMPLPHIRSTL